MEGLGTACTGEGYCDLCAVFVQQTLPQASWCYLGTADVGHTVQRDMVIVVLTFCFDELFNMSAEQTELWCCFTFYTPGFC